MNDDSDVEMGGAESDESGVDSDDEEMLEDRPSGAPDAMLVDDALRGLGDEHMNAPDAGTDGEGAVGAAMDQDESDEGACLLDDCSCPHPPSGRRVAFAAEQSQAAQVPRWVQV
jgi:hypothetical protein